MSYFIDVIIPVPLQKLFTYSITPAEANFLKPGMRVVVPFGKTKIYTGIVSHIHQTDPTAYDAKEIHQILDENPIVTPLQIELWQWISDYYMCTLGDVLRAALPNAFLLESETRLVKNPQKTIDASQLDDDEFLVYEALGYQSSLKIQDIMNILDKKQVLPVINRLLARDIVFLEEAVYEKYKPKLVRYVRLHPQYNTASELKTLLESLARAPKQRVALMTFFSLSSSQKKPIKHSELIAKSQVSPAVIKSLIDKNILENYDIQTDRLQYSESEKKSKKTQLNPLQKQAFETIQKNFETHPVTLLHGVTASGKTEVYIKLIEAVIKTGKQALYLLPEIALTTQIVTRLQSYFGSQVATYHSKYSAQERVEVWNHVLNNTPKARVILGVRSAVFLPFQDLGLIIVDEEHEPSFKQLDPAPRYHARDTAIILAGKHQAKTLLGSATPSLESFFNTQQGKYGLAEIHQRFNATLMPEIRLIDLKDKRKRKRMKGHFSDSLIETMEAVLHTGHQVILFQNRRGFAPIVQCLTCGHSPQCPNCDVSLTYHQYRQQLRCHYCGYHAAMHLVCEACGSHDIDSKGFGTEQVEEEAKLLFPKYKVGRMDFDTTRRKYGYEKIITAFEQQEIDILVGTQMLSKGLDFRHVKLVGIMNADTMLNMPDFRAHERSYQLFSQVSGRAGRTKERGKVLIQTYTPAHPILQQVATHEYLSMFEEQMHDRRIYKYAPLYKLIKITLRHRDFNTVEKASIWLAKYLRQVFAEYVLGPESPPVGRIRNQYYKTILIKIPKGQSLDKTKKVIVKINNSFLSIKHFRSVKMNINVDP